MSYQNQKISFDSSYLSSFGTLETAELTPVLQNDFVHGLNVQTWTQSFVFVITSPSVTPTNGAIYSNNNGVFTVLYSTGTTLVCYGASNPTASGTLTKLNGTGDASLTFSSFSTIFGVTKGAGATIDTNTSRLRIQSGTANGGFAYITSRKTIRYRAGEGTIARFTPIFVTGVTNSVQFWGVGSIVNNAIYDGFGFGYNGNSFGILYYNAGSLSFFPKLGASGFNGNKVDGSSGTPFNWNPSNGTPVMIKYPYLGYGDITFYVQNPENGVWILVHTIKYANTTPIPELSNPSLQFLGFVNSNGSTAN